MKNLLVIFLLLFSFLSYSQEYRIYLWDEVQNTSPDTIFGIDLSRLKLDSIPIELSKFKELKYLDVSKNKLSNLPDFISGLDSLEILNAGKNRFEVFPIVLIQLK